MADLTEGSYWTSEPAPWLSLLPKVHEVCRSKLCELSHLMHLLMMRREALRGTRILSTPQGLSVLLEVARLTAGLSLFGSGEGTIDAVCCCGESIDAGGQSEGFSDA